MSLCESVGGVKADSGGRGEGSGAVAFLHDNAFSVLLDSAYHCHFKAISGL